MTKKIIYSESSRDPAMENKMSIWKGPKTYEKHSLTGQ